MVTRVKRMMLSRVVLPVVRAHPTLLRAKVRRRKRSTSLRAVDGEAGSYGVIDSVSPAMY
jgi:hypothetical protein